MAKNLYGRYEALLDGPKRGNSKFYQLYQEYKDLYDDFASMAMTFRKDLVPQTQLKWDQNTEKMIERAYVPFYYFQEMEEEKRFELQQYTIERWEKLEELMETLSTHPYVHLVTKFPIVKTTYNYGNYTTLHNVTDVGDYNIPPWDVQKQEILCDSRTTAAYKRALMQVICQEK